MPRPAWASDALSLFVELAALPSPPGEERAVADRVLDYLGALGLEADEDDAGARIGSTMGNILCRLERHGDGAGVPLFFCAHLDTVPPEAAIEPEVGDDGLVRNAAGTILGADDKSAVASMLEAVARLIEEERPHAGVELLFTPKEEVGLVGAGAFDETRLAARLGYVYDHAGPVGEVILGAPYQRRIDVRFQGRAAHAGMYPEEGRSAIAAAARAIADLRLGRLDDETSANVGEIQGGTARNVVPEHCWFAAEARSHDERKLADIVQEMVDTITFAAGLGECEVEIQVGDATRGYRFKQDDLPVQLAVTALRRTGREPSFILSGGGADANVFNERGLGCVNLANGMTDIHTPEERIAVTDLEEMVEVTLALIEAAREVEDAA
jgi:tripeptide aminopeptidase